MTPVQEDLLNDFAKTPKISSIGKRIAAALIDALLIVVIFIVLGKFFGTENRTTTTTTITTSSSGSDVTNPATTTESTTSYGYSLTGWPFVVFMGCWFLVIPFMEGKTGQTVGKKLLKIKVTRQNGEATDIGVSFVRHLFDCIDCFLLIGLIVASTNPNKSRIGDLVARSVVVDMD